MSKTTKKTVAAEKPAKLAVVSTDTEADSTVEGTVSLQVKKKDFVERVALRSGARKPVARDLTEAVLAVLGEALAQGETLVLPPLGKMSVARSVGKAGGEILHVKLRRMALPEDAKKDADSASDPLADAEE